MSLVSVVVPVYQNAGSLADLFARLRAVAESLPGDRFEFVFVDDGSRDRSFEVLRGLAAEDPRVRVVKLSRNFGSGPAMLAGLGAAGGECMAALAADLQDPPELIPQMLELWRQGRKVVLAARRSRADPLATRLLAGAFYRLFRRFALPNMPRQGFDFFLLDRSVRDLIAGIQENNAYLMGLILWMGFDPGVVEYDRVARPARYGPSTWGLGRRVKHFIDSFTAFSYFPLRAASVLGVVVAVFGVLYAGLVVALRVVHGFPVEGWASIMVAVLLLSGVQLLMIGVLGEYLWRNLEETRRRPRYIVAEVVEGAGAPPPAKDARPQPAAAGQRSQTDGLAR
ncbi:MAG TPA: glycosyltransferase family 2 protein [Vicinamibacteria bacterium]|nr:glycosyltransferase family 2 protein [Vicinamibacteria bacterium]